MGDTRGFRRTRTGDGRAHGQPKRVFVRPLHPAAQARLSGPFLDPQDRRGAPKRMLTADQMRALPDVCADIPDPRRRQGRRHPLPAVLAIATAAVLCGMRGYKAIGLWAQDLSQRLRARRRCRHLDRTDLVPSTTAFARS